MAGLFTRAQYEEWARQASDDYRARKGADQIAFADQNVHFETWDQIWKWLQWVESQVADRPRTRYAATSKGA
jgi:hypothetical protein